MKVIYVVNEARFFLSHRLALGLAAQDAGAEVMVVAAPETGEERLAQYGIGFKPVPLSRSGFKLRAEWRAYRELLQIYRTEQPDIVHHVTIKPVMYGTIAARRSHVKAVVNAVPGMGFVFTRRGAMASIRRAIVNVAYRFALVHKNMRVIFQNTEDLRGFIGHAIVGKEDAVLIRGSGVDLQEFQPTDEPAGPPTFLLVGRMLCDKGVREFVKAAGLVRQSHPDWRFLLVGDVDPGNPSTLYTEELVAWQDEFGVEWLGQQENVADLMRRSHVVVLPSYREGLPKTLLEGAAIGRPLIASDVAGCREVVADQVTGLLVPAREVEPLAQAMIELGGNAELRRRLGDAARQKAEAVFSVDDVVTHTFRVYDELLQHAG
jgi:glycosyltransferase involved in cell wall biosynthesis